MNLKYAFALVAVILLGCQRTKTKTAENLDAIKDSSHSVDSKKKAILNHRY